MPACLISCNIIRLLQVDLEPELPGSLSLLLSAHQYLGQKSCCTMDHGRLLNYMVDIFVPIVTFDPRDRVYRYGLRSWLNVLPLKILFSILTREKSENS